MVYFGYNERVVNHIKNSENASRAFPLPFSTDVRGIDTMSDITPNAPAFKTCTKCEKTLPLSNFSVNRKAKDNLHPYCKACARAYGKEWRANNRARRLEYMRQWHEANLEHETRYARERYHNDEDHRRRVLGWQQQWRANNLELARVHDRTRGQATDWTTAQVRARTTVNRAVSRGLLPPAWSMVCDCCQEAQAAHWHHHKGYEREHWLDVVAACLDCHGLEHSSV